MPVPVGLNVWSRLVEDTFPYLDQTAEPFESLWFPDHVQCGAYCEPRPDPLPPVVVGGHGEKYLLRAVAKHADWWNYSFRDDATYAHKQEVLKTHCAEVGRDYDEIVQVLRAGILIAETEAE